MRRDRLTGAVVQGQPGAAGLEKEPHEQVGPLAEFLRGGQPHRAAAHGDGPLEPPLAAGGGGHAEDLEHVLEEQVRDHGHGLQVGVDLAHEPLHPALAVAVLVAQCRGQVLLVVEHQVVALPPAQLMQPVADAGEHGPGPLKGLTVGVGQHARALHRLQVRQAEHAAGHPVHGLDVAQAARALLDVRFEQKTVAAVPAPPLGPPSLHGADELLAAPLEDGGGVALAQFFQQRSGAGDQAGVEQGHLEGEILPREPHRLFDRAHAVTDLVAGVPEGIEQGPGRGLQGLTRALVVEQEQVDVRIRVEFATAVAAERNHCHLAGNLAGRLGPVELLDDERIRQRRVAMQQLPAVQALPPLLGQLLLARAERPGHFRPPRGRSRRCARGSPAPPAGQRSCRHRSCRCGPP